MVKVMHRKFLIFGRICSVFGVLSTLVLLALWIVPNDITLPAPIAYFMLISILLTVLCLLIGFMLDIMSHLLRKDMSSVFWLFGFTVLFAVVQVVYAMINVQMVDYTVAVYNGFLIAAGLRGFWYIIGIRQYEIKL